MGQKVVARFRVITVTCSSVTKSAPAITFLHFHFMVMNNRLL